MIILRNLESDGLFEHRIKSHSLQKIVCHNYYAEVFATSMKGKWPQRAYLGLFSGPGRARIEETGEIVETSPLAAVRLPFTHYVFVDKDARCTDALRARAATIKPETGIAVITADVSDAVPEITRTMQGY